jgi:hypothetical protein
MIIAIAIILGLLPIIIGSLRSVGWTAGILIALSTLPTVWLSIVGMHGLAAVPWAFGLLVACCATNGRDVEERKRHTALMTALRPAPPPSDHPVDRFMRETPNLDRVAAGHRPAPNWDDLVRKVPRPEGPASAWEQMHQ